MLITQPTKRQLEAMASAKGNIYFEDIIKFFKENYDALVRKSLKTDGSQGDKLKGAALLLDEILTQIDTARVEFDAVVEGEKEENFGEF